MGSRADRQWWVGRPSWKDSCDAANMTRIVASILRDSWRLAFLFGVAAAVSSAAAAAGAIGTIELIGTVPVRCEVTIRNLDGALDLVAGETAKPVAEIVETCNEPAGYTIAFGSGNAGYLVSRDGIRVDYRIDYDTAANVDLAADLALDRAEARFDFVRPLRVSIDPAGGRLAGTYSDIITVTVTAR